MKKYSMNRMVTMASAAALAFVIGFGAYISWGQENCNGFAPHPDDDSSAL